MFKKAAIQIANSKLTSAPLLPSSTIVPASMILIGGIVAWRLWRKQSQLESQTSELHEELKNVKKQVAEIKGDRESEASLSSSLKKMTKFSMPWFKT